MNYDIRSFKSLNTPFLYERELEWVCIRVNVFILYSTFLSYVFLKTRTGFDHYCNGLLAIFLSLYSSQEPARI